MVHLYLGSQPPDSHTLCLYGLPRFIADSQSHISLPLIALSAYHTRRGIRPLSNVKTQLSGKFL